MKTIELIPVVPVTVKADYNNSCDHLLLGWTENDQAYYFPDSTVEDYEQYLESLEEIESYGTTKYVIEKTSVNNIDPNEIISFGNEDYILIKIGRGKIS